MFCPNCGKDCGNSAFCPNCGIKLSKLEVSGESAVITPMGRYAASDGYVDISYFTMTIHKEILSQKVEHVIKYQDIVDVLFCPASNSSNGYFAIQEKTDQPPLIETEWDAFCTEKALIFGTEMNDAFYRVSLFVRQFASSPNLMKGNTQLSESMRSQKAAIRATTVCCPKCQSERFYAHEKVWHRPYTRGKSLIIAIISGIFYLYHFYCLRGTECVCLNCGHRWTLR